MDDARWCASEKNTHTQFCAQEYKTNTSYAAQDLPPSNQNSLMVGEGGGALTLSLPAKATTASAARAHVGGGALFAPP